MVKGSCNLDFLWVTWIIDLAADQACVADHLKSYRELFGIRPIGLLFSNLRVAANKQNGTKFAFSLVRLLQDLSKKLDIGHKLSWTK